MGSSSAYLRCSARQQEHPPCMREFPVVWSAGRPQTGCEVVASKYTCLQLKQLRCWVGFGCFKGLPASNMQVQGRVEFLGQVSLVAPCKIHLAEAVLCSKVHTHCTHSTRCCTVRRGIWYVVQPVGSRWASSRALMPVCVCSAESAKCNSPQV